MGGRAGRGRCRNPRERTKDSLHLFFPAERPIEEAMDRMDQTTEPPRIARNEGGPWGGQDEDTAPRGKSGPRNPWTPPSPDDGGRGPDRGPSAFDELLRRARDSFGGGGGMGGQAGGGRLLFYVIGAVLVAWVLFTSSHSIGQRQRGVVSLLGSYSRTLGPGMNFTLPRLSRP